MFKSVETVLRARSLAIVGASDRGKWPSEIYAGLRDGGYNGKIYPINPRYSEIWGGPCYPGFGALPEAVEHAAVIVPAQHVIRPSKTGSSTASSRPPFTRPVSATALIPNRWRAARG